MECKASLAQSCQKEQHNKGAQERDFKAGDSVFMHTYSEGTRWVPGSIVQETGPVSARVQLEGAGLAHRHLLYAAVQAGDTQHAKDILHHIYRTLICVASSSLLALIAGVYRPAPASLTLTGHSRPVPDYQTLICSLVGFVLFCFVSPFLEY